MKIDEIIDNFAFFDTWEDKYRYIIELGEQIPELSPALQTDEWKVKGCQSQVWLVPQKQSDGTILFSGNSDAVIVKGLISIVLSAYNGLTPKEMQAVDIEGAFEKMGLEEHLSPSRRNGLEAMVEKIKFYATALS